MQEQSLFIEALERDDPAGRAAILDHHCGAASRQLQRRLGLTRFRTEVKAMLCVQPLPCEVTQEPIFKAVSSPL